MTLYFEGKDEIQYPLYRKYIQGRTGLVPGGREVSISDGFFGVFFPEMKSPVSLDQIVRFTSGKYGYTCILCTFHHSFGYLTMPYLWKQINKKIHVKTFIGDLLSSVFHESYFFCYTKPNLPLELWLRAWSHFVQGFLTQRSSASFFLFSIL